MDNKKLGIEIMKEICELFDRLTLKERDFFIKKLTNKCSISWNKKHFKNYKD